MLTLGLRVPAVAALIALKLVSEELCPALFCLYPFTHRPRRIMTHVNAMSTVQVRHPVLELVLMKTYDAAQLVILPSW